MQTNSISLHRESLQLGHPGNAKSRDRLDELLGGCMALQKLYGRDVANAGTVISMFQKVLANYDAALAIKAVETWLQRSEEFPTPANIISLIQRNGKPPLKESDIIAIRKKHGEDRTRAEWDTLQEWESLQQTGWGSTYCDEVKESATIMENIRLRLRIRELESEAARAWAEVKALRAEIPTQEIITPQQQKIANTVAAMRESGAPENDINEFLQSVAA